MSKIFLLVILSVFLMACGSNGDGTASADNSDVSNSTTETSSDETSSDKTLPNDTGSGPIELSKQELANNFNSLSKYTGRTFILEGNIKRWDAYSVVVNVGDTIVSCDGNFAGYEEAIELFKKHQEMNNTVTITFNGVLTYVTGTELQMDKCNISDMQKPTH